MQSNTVPSRWLAVALASALGACATGADTSAAAERYRCEAGIEFSARFSGESVTLDSTRGYELLFRDAKPQTSSSADPPKPNEYRNPRMSAEFKLGKDGREALLRYPLLPLMLRCVKDL
jgi:hypothetical protein